MEKDRCLQQPHRLGNRLAGFKTHYKIQLKSHGYRMVYEVIDQELLVLMIALGNEKNAIYKKAAQRRNGL